MATSTSTVKTAKRPAARHPRLQSGECIPAYGLADGARSFRYGLRARERVAVDRALEILGRYMRNLGTVFLDPVQLSSYIALQLGGEPREQFAVMYLDSQHRAIAFEILFSGTLTQTSVHPREIAQAALQHQAAAVVLAHNHPSGSLQPSRADEALTQTLKETLALFDVRVLDHVIVGGSETLSMAAAGLL